MGIFNAKKKKMAYLQEVKTIELFRSLKKLESKNEIIICTNKGLRFLTLQLDEYCTYTLTKETCYDEEDISYVTEIGNN